VLICYLTRRRIGAYFDGALDEGRAPAVAAHLDACARCRREAEGLGRLRELISSTADIAEPDWTGFWPAIVRGVQAGIPDPAPIRSRAAQPRRRGTLVGAAAAALIVVTLWHAGDSPIVLERTVTVSVADTEHPGGSVMVYSPPGDDMTVIWVFGLDTPGTI